MRRLVAAALLAVAAAGCSGDDEGAAPAPRAEWIAPALAAVEAQLGAEPELLEVSATLEHVDVIVRRAPGEGVLYRYADGTLSGPVEPRADARDVFTPDAVTVDPDRVFDGIRSELPTVTILDLALRQEGGVVVIDATVASTEGGVLLVLLGGDGTVLGSQPV